MDILLQTANNFYITKNLPLCVGALDVCHMRIKKPPGSGSRYFNYKRFYSIMLQALVDPYLRFISIDVGGVGSQYDATTFRNSTLYNGLKSNIIELPPDDKCFKTHTVIPYFIIADGAYPFSNNLIKPYPGDGLFAH
ncbi:hypothetical protein TKK_0015623 [Trichogramma kaykai]